MPVTLVDRLPLPNLKVYTAGSVSLLSIAVYYALSVTSDPGWRLNATLSRQEGMAEVAGAEPPPPPLAAPPFNATSRNLTEQFVDVVAFMMQEPLCMWTVINIAYCSLALAGAGIRRAVFGRLRVAEAQRVRDKLWNYVFYKFIFVFGVANVQFMDEVLLWCGWFTLVGFLHLLSQLAKDRYEYLSSSPSTGRWAHARLGCLLGGLLVAAGALLAAAAKWGLPAGRDTFAFMAAECVLVLAGALHVCARYALQLRGADACGALAYYTHLAFDSTALVVELCHVVHMVVYSNLLVSMASLVLLMQLRHLLHELQARLRRHRLYTSLATHMSRNYPMASREEVEKNQDKCAICWEPMKEARKLPCHHLFHNSCLCQWVQQDASCPTCRRALAARGAGAAAGAAPPATAGAPAPGAPAPAQPNHLFHFDGSRYVSWLPSFSVEVTRVRGELPVEALQLAAQLADGTLDDVGERPARELSMSDEPEPPAAAAPPPSPAAALSAPPSSAAPALAPLQLQAAADDPPATSSSYDADESSSDACQLSGVFSCVAAEREAQLQRRKAQLRAAARARYLHRLTRPRGPD